MENIFLKHFKIFKNFLHSILNSNFFDEVSHNIAKNQLFILSCVENGMVSNPDLIMDLIFPQKVLNNQVFIKDFYSTDIDKDANQCNAVNKILGANNLVVIQGPPGAGKTTVIVEAIRQIKKRESNAKILLSSQTHVAVDNVMEKLLSTDLSLLRLKDKDKSKGMESIGLNSILENIVSKNSLISEYVDDLAMDYLNELIFNKDVIGITINALKGCKLNGFNSFDFGIVDEIGKATLPEILFVAKYCKKLIIIGDPKQLPPTLNEYIDSQLITKEEYDEINMNPFVNYIFDNINPNCKVFLNKQYRMVREIGTFISDTYYNDGIDKLKNGRRDTNPQALNFIDYELNGHEVQLGCKKINNPYEVDIIEKLILDRFSTMDKNDLVIISPYKDQVGLLRKRLPDYRIDTVDSFQGQSAKVVVYTCVRNVGNPTSFIKKENRTNVAISRAKDEIWIIGNAQYIKQISHLRKYLKFKTYDDELAIRSYIHYYDGNRIIYKYKGSPKNSVCSKKCNND